MRLVDFPKSSSLAGGVFFAVAFLLLLLLSAARLPKQANGGVVAASLDWLADHLAAAVTVIEPRSLDEFITQCEAAALLIDVVADAKAALERRPTPTAAANKKAAQNDGERRRKETPAGKVDVYGLFESNYANYVRRMSVHNQQQQQSENRRKSEQSDKEELWKLLDRYLRAASIRPITTTERNIVWVLRLSAKQITA